MKTQMMVALTIFFLPYSGFSVTGRDSWQTIRSDHEVIIQHPVFAGALGPLGLFNACTTDEEFRSKTPVQTCLSYRQIIRTSNTGSHKDYVCNDYESKNITISRTYTQEECVKHDRFGECLEYDSVTSVYPTSFQLVVIESSTNPSGNLLFSKAYTIPACD